MCGIAGIFSESVYESDEAVMGAMANAMMHRGPDELACYAGDGIRLGFRRLSIVDVANGHQPFFSNDGTAVMVCNGEIYNYRELRAELESRGCVFSTNCDVEVLVHLYSLYGTDFADRLNGQFAFAVFDSTRKRLFIARDQFGICPLFYTEAGGRFLFASEIKALLKHPLVRREVNPEGLDQVLTFPGLVSPVTVFKDIHSLAPGHCMIITAEGHKTVQYWDLIYPELNDEPPPAEKYCEEKLESLLLDSVKYRLNADVPVGFYLSGGLDSSLIGALMKAVNPAGNYPSFSIGFPADAEMNESFYQQQMVDSLGLVHHRIAFGSTEVEQRINDAVWAAESPLKETYNTCSLALSEAVNRAGIKVVLSGEGADELFGGYVGYRFDSQRINGSRVKDLEEQLEDECRRKLWGDRDFFYEKNYYDFAETRRSLYSPALREKFAAFNAAEKLQLNRERLTNRHILHKRSYIDLKLRLSDHLIADHCDRVAYANSVEGRYPFLDINLVEFVKTIPPQYKLNGLTEKYILKKLAAKYIPPAIVNRQKFGFVAPGSPPMLRKNTDRVNDLLSYDRIKRQGYFDPDVTEFLRKQYSRDDFRLNLPFDSDLLIVVLTFNIFLELFEMPDFS